jgi:plastocyanin
VAVPRILFAVPFLVLGAAAPALAHTTSAPADRSNLVGMRQESFSKDTVTLHVGEPLELFNDSNFLHVVAPGQDARVSDQAGEPRFGARDVVSVPRGTAYQTLTWGAPGVYHVTCTLHPDMNLTVVVLPPR